VLQSWPKSVQEHLTFLFANIVKDLQKRFGAAGFEPAIRALNAFEDDYGLRNYEIVDSSNDEEDDEVEEPDEDKQGSPAKQY